MSLINNMLKDLEKREQTSRYRPAIVMAGFTRKISLINFNHKSFWISLLSSILLTTILLMITTDKKNPQKKSINKFYQTQSTPAPINRLTNDNLWLTTTTINAITIQEKDNISEIFFLLDHPALYRLVSNDTANQLTVILDNAQLQTELPQSQTMRTAIQSINSLSKNGSVIFKLTLEPNAFIKYVNLNDDKKNPALVIAIQHESWSAEKPQNTTTNDVIKIPAMQSLYNEQYQSALKFAAKGEYKTAIKRLESLLSANPSYQDVRVSLSALLIDQGDPKTAETLINEGLQLTPDAIPLIELKARLLTTNGKIREALTLLRSESPLINDNPEYHAFLAALYQKNDNDLQAVDLYRKLLTINPQNGNWWFGLGLSLEKLGEKSLAYNAYRRAISNGNVDQDSLSYLQNHLEALQEVINDGN